MTVEAGQLLVKTIIITGYGANSETECAHAAEKAGSDSVTIAHFADIATGRIALKDYNFIIFPGGFLDGDDLGAAQAASQRWKNTLSPKGEPLFLQLAEHIAKGGLILGIGNGFQLLAKLGLLPAIGEKPFEQQVAFSTNASGCHEDRWCHLQVNKNSPCIFTSNLTDLYLPVRHAEGYLVAKDQETLDSLESLNLIALRYAHSETGLPTQEYPHNPSGSPLAIAGICDTTGRVFGLMPHPDGYTHPTNHPGWTRGETSLLGTVVFENAVSYLKNKG